MISKFYEENSKIYFGKLLVGLYYLFVMIFLKILNLFYKFIKKFYVWNDLYVINEY